MSEIETAFSEATERAKSLPSKPDDETLLEIYALYKQATSGDVTGDRPGFFDFVGGAKFDAWEKLEGTSEQDAMQKYIDLINSLAG
ncbi:MAG: acyl-CoA-binding protein [bacterium]